MGSKETLSTSPRQETVRRRGKNISPGRRLRVIPGESPSNPTTQVRAETLAEELNRIAELGRPWKP